MAKHRKPPRRSLRLLLALLLIPVAAFLTETSLSPLPLRASLTVPRAAPARIHPQEPSRHHRAPEAVLVRYVIRSGDTLWSVAAAHCGTGSDFTSLAHANHITHPDEIFAGRTLVLAC